MSDDLIRYLHVIAAVAIPLAGLWLAITIRDAWTRARGVIDDAASKTRHPSQVRTYCGTCGHEDCTCGTGVGDQVEAWLRDRPYDWASDEGSGLA